MIKKAIFTFLILILWNSVKAQGKYDSVIFSTDSIKKTKVMCYTSTDQMLIYKKPSHFGFITGVPKTLNYAAHETCRKASIPALSVIGASTLLLLAFDQQITDNLNHFSNYVDVSAQRDYKTIIHFKMGSMPVNVYEAPQNFNTVLYSLGEGSTTVAIAAGFFLYGKFENDYRALQTSSQLIQALLAVGITTQLTKHITGRESPFVASAPGGKWSPFTNPAVSHKNATHYDAFPSGHMATMMTTLIVIADNYPEKLWIKPIGYILMSFAGLAMINNGVHWASDYPLALGIGYVCGKVTVKMNRWIRKTK